MKGRKIYFNKDYDYLIKMIDLNTEVMKIYEKNENSNKYNRYIHRNEKIIGKLKTYKKVDENNNTFLYLFPNELEDIMWILFENNLVSGFVDIDEEVE